MNQLLKIGSNTQANMALRNLYRVNNKVAIHQERLSTGKRINSAKDDAAGFALASDLKERLSGMKIAKQNIQNAQSVLTIVEAGQQKSIELLQEMREKMLRVQDATLTSNQRQSLLDQLTELKTELTDIYNSVKWNSSTPIPGSTISFQVGEETSDTFAVTTSMIQGSTFSAFASNSATASAADITAIDTHIDNAISYAQSTGSKISRLSNKLDGMTTRIATTESVRSTIEDADFAEEQMELIKAQIMQQTATAALSQANTAPQIVLQLFQS